MNIPNLGFKSPLLTVLSIAAAGLAACGGSPKAATAPTTWTVQAADPGVKAVVANRTVALDGGGVAALKLNCNFRPSADKLENGFWLKLEVTLQGVDGAVLGLDAAALEDGKARLLVTRSTGEQGGMVINASDASHFTYQNSRTNEANYDNNDPAKVELAQSVALPLANGRTTTMSLHKDEAGYKELLSRCAELMPPTALPEKFKPG